MLADLLRAGRFPSTRLTQIFRQGAGSGIATNAARINAGEMPRFGGDVADCFFLPADDPADRGGAGRRTWSPGGSPPRYGFAPGEIQVLAPMHRGDAGVGALNTLLQERLNPAREGDGGGARRAGGSTARATGCCS